MSAAKDPPQPTWQPTLPMTRVVAVSRFPMEVRRERDPLWQYMPRFTDQLRELGITFDGPHPTAPPHDADLDGISHEVHGHVAVTVDIGQLLKRLLSGAGQTLPDQRRVLTELAAVIRPFCPYAADDMETWTPWRDR